MNTQDDDMTLRELNAADRRKEGWSLGREILGTIIGVITVSVPIVSGLIVWGTHVESILTVHSSEIIYLHKENDAQDRTAALAVTVENTRLQRIEDKVDKLIERPVITGYQGQQYQHRQN